MQRIAQRDQPVKPGDCGVVAAGDNGFSPLLHAANCALHARRTAIGRMEAAATPALPSHLGWHSPAVTRCLNRPQPAAAVRPEAVRSVTDDAAAGEGGRDSAESAPIRVYPALLQALRQQQLTAPGRIWLLARHLDRDGRGWLPVATLRRHVAARRGERDADLRVCGQRRLRQLLRQGHGIFWQRDDADRLWLHGPARVAAALGVARLDGAPVLLPLRVVTASIGVFNAHCYAAFHSGRRRAHPISRRRLVRLTGVPARTQRTYEQRAAVQATANYAVLGRYSAESATTATWHHGAAVFTLRDVRGRFGRPGQSYVARQLPNHYHVPRHRRTARGRQRKINRQLKVLVNQPAQGNRSAHDQPRYFADAVPAVAAAAAGAPISYWPLPTESLTHRFWMGVAGGRQ